MLQFTLWAKLRPSQLHCTLSELRCTLSELRCALRATLHPSELCCTLLSYATPFRATLHPTELRLTLNDLRGTLKNKWPPLTHRSFADPSGKINNIQWKPREIFTNKRLLFRPELGLPGAYYIQFFFLTRLFNHIKKCKKSLGFGLKYTFIRISWHIMGPSVISQWTSEAKKYNVPCHRSCADGYGKINYM